MRSARSMGRATSTSWSALLLTLLSTVSVSTVYAKDQPTIEVTEFKNPPTNPSYFPDSNVILFQENGIPATTWRSSDGGTTWNKATGIDHDKSAQLIMHRYDPNRAYVLTFGNVHWKTADKGETWQEFSTGACMNDFVGESMTFHADDPDKILFNGINCQGNDGRIGEEVTMYTTDGFEKKANVLRRQAQACWWAKSTPGFTTGNVDLDAIRTLCVVRSGFFSPQYENRLYMSDHYFKSLDGDALDETEVKLKDGGLAGGVVRLVAVQKFLLAATSSPNTAEMALFVTDDAEVWHRAMFPQDHPITESAYTILESTEYSIQVDVRTSKHLSSPMAMGTLLTSNSNGTYFTRNIEHTNRDQNAYVDFEKVTGIQGIFLVNQVDNWEAVANNEGEKKVKTSITFDDGRTFEAITAGDKDLHLHSVTELKNAGKVFSSPAPGLVMGCGNRGKFLKGYEESNLYVSDDAGKSWTEGLKGPHKYEFGDQGSILVAVRDSKEADVQEIKYSLDHGQTWETTKLPDGLSVHPRTLTTTPDSTSLKFVLTAQKESKESSSWSVISIDFEGLHEDTCKDSDMEDWYARKDENGPSCVMGHTQKFLRRKKDAKCFIKKEFKEPVPETSRCKCTSADFECDFNFVRVGDECQLEGSVPTPEGACKTDDPEETFMGSSGWRRIPGNQCEDGEQKDKKKEWKCSDHRKPPSNSTGEVSVTIKTFEGDYDGVEKHYLERGDLSPNGDETIIARPGAILGRFGDVVITHDHGKTWATPKVLKDKDISYIITHAYNRDMAFFLTTDEKVYYTTDGGKSIDSFEAPTPLDPDSNGFLTLSFHPDRPEWLIWHGQKCTDDNCYREASVSTDRGDNWHTLRRYVQQCQFTGSSAYIFRSKSQVVCSARAHESNDFDDNPLQLVYTDDFREPEFTAALENIRGFATMAEFIVVVTRNESEDTMSALASLDGKQYAVAHFPSNFQVSHTNGYTVLDSSTRAVNLYVATQTERGRQYGSILKSNSNGTSYVMSISGVNANNDGYVDFEKMLGLEGVALVNTVANQDSGSDAKKNLQTRISHNDGAQWSFLPPPPKDAQGKPYSCSSRTGDPQCALHIHGYTERVDRGKTYSSESAIGLMFGIGNVGPILGEKKDADTFMTQDAGLTWKEVKKGAWIWSFGDQGSIIVLAQRNTKTRSVSYSLDRGESWQDLEFSDRDVTIADITTLRSGSSRNFAVWGNNGKEIFAANLDFSGLTDRPCVHDENDAEKSDYELWSPEHPLQPNGCLFGHRNQYLRKKKDRLCYNDRQLQEVYNSETCECTREDYECDYNYELDNHNYCVLVEGLRPKDPEQVCRDDPEATEYHEPSRLRRIPLSTCRGGAFDPENVFKIHPCPGHEEEFKKKHGVSGVAIFFAVVIPILIAALAGWWVYSNWQGKFGQIRLGEQSTFDNDAPWIKYPVVAISAIVAVVGALPLLISSAWRTARSTFSGLVGRGGSGGRYGWVRSGGPRRFTTRDSFARGRGDYAIVDEDEGELLGDDSDDEI